MKFKIEAFINLKIFFFRNKKIKNSSESMLRNCYKINGIKKNYHDAL